MTSNDPFASDPSGAAAQPDPQDPSRGDRRRKVVLSVALVAAGLLIGGAATGIAVASAKGPSSHPAADAAPNLAGGGQEGPGDHNADRDQRPPQGFGDDDRQPPNQLSGDTLVKVTDAVIAAYPGATVERAFPLPDGTYIAHVQSSDGEKYVALDSNFTVTGEQPGPGGPGGFGPRPDGDGHHGFGHDGPDDDSGGIQLPSDGATSNPSGAAA